MFKLLSVLLLALMSAQAFATQPFYCSVCGTPYSDAGRQTYANYAHNLAWGKNPVALDNRAPRTDNVGAFDVRITNHQGHTVTVRYRPSLSRIIRKAFYFGDGSIDSLTLILPDNQVKTVRVVYRPGADYVIRASDGSGSNSGGSGGAARSLRANPSSYAHLASYINANRWFTRNSRTPDYSGWENLSSGHPLVVQRIGDGKRKVE